MSNHTEIATRPFIVCPTCEGKGSHGPGHVFTQDDRDEYGDDFYDMMEDYRAGRYDVICEECQGQRVVKADCACIDCQAEREQEWEWEQERMAEIRMGC